MSEMPLEGLLVLDLSNLYAGPMVSTILGDYGATVVKVEHPRGDDARRWGLSKDGVPLWWKFLARNKELVKLDLNDEADRDVARELALRADVVIENYRPGRLEKWGLGYDDLASENPGLVMLKVTGFGQYGPMSQEPGFGTLAEAFSGFAFITGQPDGPPTLPPFGLADGVAALTGAYAVMMALYWRDVKGGTGQYIDLALYEPLFTILGPQVIEYDQLGVIQQRHGNRSPRTAPRNAYQTQDGHWIATSAGTQEIANRIFAVIERPELAEDPRFSTTQARLANADEVDELVASWVREHNLNHVLARFREFQAPAAPIYDASQIRQDPHYLARETIVEMDDPDLGRITMQNVVPKLSRTPGRIRHTGKVEIGADQDIIEELLQRKREDR
jgi:crotonobetainyl-CoA:carnitine CoA-transferase CaiB-like acyl-CoA transferase